MTKPEDTKPGATASQSAQASQPLVGHLGVLDLASSVSAVSWVEQFEIYTELNSINESKKVLLFLSHMGVEAYNTLREIVLPEVGTFYKVLPRPQETSS